MQGLHDDTQPHRTAPDVRRYAYWSVFAGACGHTYGDNSLMQFYTGHPDDKGSYGAVCTWKEALHHEGSGQMKYLKELMESVDFTTGKASDELLLDGQKEKYDRIAVFSGKDFIFAYDFTGRSFKLDVSKTRDADIWLFSPANGIYSYIGKADNDIFCYEKPKTPLPDTDIAIVIKK